MMTECATETLLWMSIIFVMIILAIAIINLISAVWNVHNSKKMDRMMKQLEEEFKEDEDIQ